MRRHTHTHTHLQKNRETGERPREEINIWRHKEKQRDGEWREEAARSGKRETYRDKDTERQAETDRQRQRGHTFDRGVLAHLYRG